MPHNSGDLLTVKEAAGEAGVHPNTVRAWIKRKILRASRLPNKRYRIRRGDIFAG